MLLEFKLKRAEKLTHVLRRALEIAEKIKACRREYDGFLSGLEGKYIMPSPSGSITKGKIDILPTGRNFYAVDPTIIPTPAAWKVGVEAANKLIRYYFEKHGKYPESIGQWLISIDGYKADGEQLAQILYLLGTKPTWNQNGSVKDVEVIPLEELGRPRIDVVVRISGIVRDTLPNYIYLIDSAISKVITLNEPLELNYVKKHYLEYLERLREMGGGSDEEAKCRVWCSPPGTYGAGVNYAVEASAWKSNDDLAKVWVQWGCYMYTKKSFGKPSPKAFILNLSTVDIVTRNHMSDEHDLFNCCCYFSYQGGFYNTVKSLTGKDDVEVVIVDTRDLSFIGVRSVKSEIERIVRAKLLNPAWISEMKKHGYRGANEFSRKILHLYGWSATTKLVDDWVFNEIAKTYVLNDEMRRWFEENNVWALEEITRRLIEAAERGLWMPPEDILERLREAYAEVEGYLEETIMGESDIQGSSINWFSPEEVERWKNKLTEITESWEKLAKALRESDKHEGK